MVKRILIVWLIANFGFVGLAFLIAHQWYVGWQVSPIAKMWVELGLILLPNLVLPVVVLKYWWDEPIGAVNIELGWIRNGWKAVLTGIVMFAVLYGAIRLASSFVGESIPYNLSGAENTIRAENPLAVLGLLASILGFVVLTVTGEETMFRGLVQTQMGKRYGTWVGLLVAAVLFGLRHLPNDIYYAQVWQATPRMWLSRELQLYSTAVVLGLARHIGKSTYASAITHGLLLIAVLFGFL